MVRLGRLLALVSTVPLLVAGTILPKCPVADTSIVAHTGRAVGTVKDIQGGKQLAIRPQTQL